MVKIQGSLNKSDFVFAPNSTTTNLIRADEYDLDITGATGRNLIITLTSSNGSFDPFLEAIDPTTGAVLKSDNNSGGGTAAQLNNTSNVTVPNSGKLKVRVTNASGTNLGNGENPYDLEVIVSDLSNADIKLKAKDTVFGTPQTGASVSINGQFNTTDFNFLTPGGLPTRADEYKLETTAVDQDITITLTRQSGSNNDYDSFLQVINADTGAIVADSDDDGGNFKSTIKPGLMPDGDGNDDPAVPNSLVVQGGVNYIIRVTSFNQFPNPSQGASTVDYKLDVSVPQGTATVSPRITPILPDITISDTAKAEGNNGTTTFAFEVTLSKASDKPVTVNYATANPLLADLLLSSRIRRFPAPVVLAAQGMPRVPCGRCFSEATSEKVCRRHMRLARRPRSSVWRSEYRVPPFPVPCSLSRRELMKELDTDSNI
jgi:hypothetical protein